ncbi:hypothetical protein KY285_016047 [Solanum tuberosum]|nr:hypothetical protein KY285_016047 [Solanum tuberosum]
MTKVSSFFSNVFMFVGGTLVIVLALWSFMSPKYPNFPTINLDFNLDQEGSTNFYDEPNLSYTIEKPIQNWDDKRRQWLNLHPSFKLEGEKERILIVSGSQSTPCKNPVGDHLLLRFFKNKVDYSRIHGYDIFYNDVLLEPKMFFFWAKLPAVRAAMVAHPEAEWIWWVDSDAAFTDMNFKLPLKKYKNHNFVVYGWPKLIYENKSWTGINAGVFLIRNCQWSMDLIEAWAKMGPQSPEYNKWGEILRTTFKDKKFPQSDDQSDNQVLRKYGFLHNNLLDSSTVFPLPFDFPSNI